MYYTEVDLSPPKALQAYKEALRIGIEMGMHPFSDEVVGIKIQVAMMLERAGLAKAAVEVLERTKGEIMGFVEGKDRGEGVIGVNILLAWVHCLHSIHYPSLDSDHLRS